MQEYTTEIETTISTASSLVLGDVSAAIINSVASILMIRYLGPEQYGLLSVAFVIIGFFSLFRDWGVPIAASRLAAKVSKKEKNKFKIIVNTTTLIELVASSIMFILAFLSVDVISVHLLKKPVNVLARVALVLLFIDPMQTVYNYILIGRQKTEFVAVSKILGGVIRLIGIILLVGVLGFQALGALLAYVLATFSMAVVVFTSVRCNILRTFFNGETNEHRILDLNLAKSLYSYGIPLWISKLLINGFSNYYMFIFAISATVLEIGYFTATQSAINIVTGYILLPLSTALFATFAKSSTDFGKHMLRVSIKFNSIILLLAFSGLFVLAEALICIFLTEAYEPAIFLLRLLSLTLVIQAFGGPILESYLKGVGETKVILMANVVFSSAGIFLCSLLIPLYHSFGVIFTLIATSIISLAFYTIFFIKKAYYHFTYPLGDIANVLFVTVMAIVFSTIVTFLPIVHILKLVLGISAILFVYLTLLPLLGIIRKNEIHLMHITFDSWKGIGKVIDLPLKILDKLAKS